MKSYSCSYEFHGICKHPACICECRGRNPEGFRP